MAVTQPRVLDRRVAGIDEEGQTIDAAGQPITRFSSKILPPYLRKTKAIEELIPWLYLKGVSTGDFAEALQALVGPQAAGVECHHDHAASDGLAGRAQVLEPPHAGRQTVRVSVG